MSKETTKQEPKKVIRDPFDEYSDIGKKDPGKYDFTEIGKTVIPEYENEKKEGVPKVTFFPVDPYDKNKITKRSTSLGREKKTYSLSTELVLRIHLLKTRIKQENMEKGRRKKVSESRLIEEGMRYVLKKYRYKYKDLPKEEDLEN